MVKQGRPRGYNINPKAVEDGLRYSGKSKAEVAAAARIAPGTLSNMLYREKGASEAVVRRLADALGLSPETLAPELLDCFVCVRSGDQAVA